MENNLENTDPGGRFAIAASCYYEDIIQGLIDGALRTFKEAGIDEERIDILRVPGALELPLTCQKLAQSQKYQAVLALGAVIEGGTSHYDIVINESARGLSEVALATGLPILNAILTVRGRAQANERSQDDERNKGSEAALAAIQMANLFKKLS